MGEGIGRSTVGLMIAVAVGVMLRWHQIGAPLDDEHLFRQAQTLFSASWYTKNGWDLGYAHLPVFGTATNVPFEFPIYQAAVSAVSSLGFDLETTAASVSLIVFESGAVLLWLLLKRWVDEPAAVIGAFLWQLLPFGLHWGTTPLIDFTSVALGLVAVLGADAYINDGRMGALAGASLATSLLLLVKPTTFPSIGMLLLLSAALASVPRAAVIRRSAIGVVAAILPAAALAWWWTSYADRVKAKSPRTDFLTSHRLADWNFGTTEQRLEIDNYLVIAQRLGDTQVGPWPLGIGLAIAICAFMGTRRNRRIIVGLMLAMIASPLIFFNLFLVHSYYLTAVYPVSVAILALAIATLVQKVHRIIPRVVAALLALTALIGSMLMTRSGAEEALAFLRTSSSRPALMRALDELRPSRSPIITVACDWNPALMYATGRRGLMLRGSQRVSDQELKELPYRYVVRCDRSADPHEFLPTTYSAQATDSPWIFRLERRSPSWKSGQDGGLVVDE